MLLLSGWTRSASGGPLSRRQETTLLDEVGAFLRAARWRARSWSWTDAATTPLDEVSTFLRAARWRARSWSWTAVAATLLDEDKFQLEKTLHTHTPIPPPSLSSPPPLHTSIPPASIVNPKGLPLQVFFRRGRWERNTTSHLTLSHASYFLLTRPMFHRLRRAHAAYCHWRGRHDCSRPGRV